MVEEGRVLHRFGDRAKSACSRRPASTSWSSRSPNSGTKGFTRARNSWSMSVTPSSRIRCSRISRYRPSSDVCVDRNIFVARLGTDCINAPAPSDAVVSPTTKHERTVIRGSLSSSLTSSSGRAMPSSLGTRSRTESSQKEKDLTRCRNSSGGVSWISVTPQVAAAPGTRSRSVRGAAPATRPCDSARCLHPS